MYTATLLGNTVDKQKRQRIVTVRFTEGESTFDKDFTYKPDTSVETIKRAVKVFLDDINKPAPEITGDIDDYTEPTLTKAEQDKLDWEADWRKLSAIQPYIDAGVFDGTETPIVNLRNKLKSGFKPAYLDLG